jgi:hypothetical protein
VTRRPQTEQRVPVSLTRWIVWAVGPMRRRITLSGRRWSCGSPTWAGGVLLLGSALVLTGCSSFHTEVGRPLSQTPTPLVEGETRVETVVHELGPPHNISALPDGFVFLYEYSFVREFQWGISLKFVGLGFFKLVKGHSRLSESVRILTFDEQGTLRAQGFAEWHEKLGSGGALQLIVSVLSLTDTTAFRRQPDALLWGRWLLQRPPVTLNSAQDLRTGSNGLQQRLAPAFVGQESLEMSPPRPLKVRRQQSLR